MGEILKTVAGIVLGIVGLFVVVSFFFFSEKVKIERSLVDANTYCPIDKPKSIWGIYEVHPPNSPKNTAVLIDATDRIPESHQNLISTWFKEDFTKSLGRFEKVAIYEVRPQEDSSNPVLNEPSFNQCAPPAEANKWVENPRLVREKFEESFMNRKLLVIKSLASQDEAQWSPIMEVLENLFGDYDRIVLVSDLMQNTPDCTLYRRHNTAQNYPSCQLSSQIFLDKKTLDVVFLKRQKIISLQGNALLDFWRRHVETRNGTFLVKAELPVIN